LLSCSGLEEKSQIQCNHLYNHFKCDHRQLTVFNLPAYLFFAFHCLVCFVLFCFFLLFFGGMGLEFELRVSHLESRCSTAWTTPLVHFLLWLFWQWGLVNYLFGLSLKLNPPDLSLPSITSVSHRCLSAQCFWIINMHRKSRDSEANADSGSES
jgi:hypothetical protein